MTVLTDELLEELEATITSFDVQYGDDTYNVYMCGSGCADCVACCENGCDGDCESGIVDNPF